MEFAGDQTFAQNPGNSLWWAAADWRPFRASFRESQLIKRTDQKDRSAATTVSATFAPASPALNFDIDGNGSARALTDGLLAMRYLLTLTGPALTAGAIGTDTPAATRTQPSDVLAYLNNLRPMLDIDGNGQVDAMTDGVILMRYLMGIRGSALIANAVGGSARRTSATAIETYVQGHLP